MVDSILRCENDCSKIKDVYPVSSEIFCWYTLYLDKLLECESNIELSGKFGIG